MKVTREEIILAARELFREKGYAGASMQDLASRVGLQKASLYMRFPNKEALVPAVLDATLDETFAHPDAAHPDWETAYEFVVRSIATTLSDRKRCVGLHLAYGLADDTPQAKNAVRSFFQTYLDRLGDILVRALPRETADAIAADALMRLEGATLFLAVFDAPAAMDRVVEAVLMDARRAAGFIVPSVSERREAP